MTHVILVIFRSVIATNFILSHATLNNYWFQLKFTRLIWLFVVRVFGANGRQRLDDRLQQSVDRAGGVLPGCGVQFAGGRKVRRPIRRKSHGTVRDGRRRWIDARDRVQPRRPTGWSGGGTSETSPVAKDYRCVFLVLRCFERSELLKSRQKFTVDHLRASCYGLRTNPNQNQKFQKLGRVLFFTQ